MYLFDMIMSIILMLMMMICVLISVAYLTLFERKILGYIQLRKGPNKVGFYGLFQPFADAIKLFTKEQIYPVNSNYWVYYISPIMGLFVPLFIWLVIPYKFGYLMMNLGILLTLCLLSIGVYSVMIAGWSSNSNYSLLGGLRAIAQTISYEVSLSLFLLCFLIYIESFNLLSFYYYQSNIWFIFMFIPLSMIWFVIMLAETHRSPFDFAEGESELVSGFNVEYGSGGFALIFLGEYASILFMSFMFTLIFLGDNFMNLLFFLKSGFISYMFIWARGTLPRYRYDKLMYLAWKSYLPISLNFMILYLGFKILMF
uniref:NADH-ubiquinone oxidoreductase chain 1 n=1 Tax=Conwentzia sinica TaxID=450904 RepID=A0A7U1AQA3_9NEOP|nr:NADH dehydrogenase subunit 1 [Conwentzia sinica]QQY84960.1 NADH dehydrogenase subunit 1 [Conwentzia sinica]